MDMCPGSARRSMGRLRQLTKGSMQTSTITMFIENPQQDDSTPKIYLVLGELVEGSTADGEYFVIVGAYRDEAEAARRMDAERASGSWGHHAPNAEWSQSGWLLRVEAVDLLG
jgi:hypothetical protein